MNNFHTQFNALAARVCPAFAGQLRGVCDGRDGDGFEIADGPDGAVVVTGGKLTDLTAGLGVYLKERAFRHDSWCGSRMEWFEKAPQVGVPIRRKLPLALRPYLNYCTFGYSLTWWRRQDWEREIDRMALSGVNMPLAVTGVEAVWQRTLLRFGLTHDETRAFLSGPAFLPWQYMNNINSHAGPLPQHWIDTHLQLGRWIVDRERELGMEPILPGFSGHVPEAFAARHPDVHYIRSAGWCNFAPVAVIDPADPMFYRVMTVYLEELKQLFGPVRYYSIDLFHEQLLEGATPEYYRSCGEGVSRALLAADPGAIWVMQVWSERADIIKAVPPEHLLLLDIGKERLRETDGLYHVPAVWGTIHSFGGQTEIGGDLRAIPREISALRKRYRNLIGAGAFPESICNNLALFELVFDSALCGGELDLDKWLAAYLQRRYGAVTGNIREAWRLMLRDVYTARRGDPIFAARPALNPDRANAWAGFKAADSPARFFPAWRLLTAAATEGVDSEGFRFDVVDLGRQALSALGPGRCRAVREAFAARKRPAFRLAAEAFLELMRDCDRLLATRPEFRLDHRLREARGWGRDAAEKALYEFNVRLQLTLWGPVGRPEPLFDYCCREWSGLLREYYLVRWRMFFDFLDKKLEHGESYDDSALPRIEGRITLQANEFYRELYCFEQEFAGRVSDDAALEASCRRREDELLLAQELIGRYAPDAAGSERVENTDRSDLLTGFAGSEGVLLS